MDSIASPPPPDGLTTLGIHAVMLGSGNEALAAALHAARALGGDHFQQATTFLAAAARALGRAPVPPVQDEIVESIREAASTLAGGSAQAHAIRATLALAERIATGTDPIDAGETIGRLIVWTGRLETAMDTSDAAPRLAA